MDTAPRSDAAKILPQFAFALVAFVAGGAVVWWNGRDADPAPPKPNQPAAEQPVTPATPAGGDVTAAPEPVAFNFLDDWRYPGAEDQLETAGLQRPGYFSKTAPKEIAALDGRRITIDGFVLPIELDDDGRIMRCMLLRHQLGCGYGKAPTPSQRISVTLAPGAQIDLRFGQPATAIGVLTVFKQPEGVFPALYAMTVESLVWTTGYNPDAAESAAEASGESGGSGG